MSLLTKHVPNQLKLSTGVAGLVSRLVFLVILDLAAAWFVAQLASLGYFPFAAAVAMITVAVNLILLIPKAYPLRWMVVGLVLMVMFTIYPIVFTVWVSFTNYGEGHLVTKQQAIAQILKLKYLPASGQSYKWTAYRSPDGQYALWLQDAAGNGYLAKPGEPLLSAAPGQAGVGELDEKGIPKTIEGYRRLSTLQAAADKNLTEIQFGEAGKTIQIRSPGEAAELLPLYVYDEAQDAMINQETGVVYRNLRGAFTAPGGQSLQPGFIAPVQFDNFRDFFLSPALRGPLLRVITWNFGFAFFSLLLNFSLGLAIAVLFNDPRFPFKKIIRSLLIIPYTVPALITILIWRGMMNPQLGVINRTMNTLFGWSPPWFTDEWWAKIAILLVNLWLSYPYFMLVCSGALQSISEDYYAAAQVDGASPWQQFRYITLPLLLVAVGPLLVASFTFNFNNFNLIYLFNAGGPPIAGSPTPAGHTDILISYVYNLAFSGSRGINYGFASAITIIIFFIVGAITLFQFRYTRMWEEVSENV
ncbi:MAG: maltose ABC transporter permease MalF [Anaerolineae bacterium]|nr:MAG: maltose ABC transporter permease MalF [Anaerolineae bacterium]